MIEDIAKFIPQSLSTVSGSVFYSGRNAFKSTSALYVLGLNPGGFVQNEGIELSESYQIDRKAGAVLFIKSRIGTATVLPGAPDIVGAFVGKATLIPQ